VAHELRLADFSANRLYLIDAETGAPRSVHWTPGAAFCGFGAIYHRRLLPPRQEVFLAIYSQSNALWLRIDKTDFNLCDKQVQVSVTMSAPFRRRLLVTSGQAVEVNLKMWAKPLELFEEPADGDFLAWVAEIAESPEAIRYKAILWDASSRELDVGSSEVQQSVERRYREASGLLP
jgi:hypothetical protein